MFTGLVQATGRILALDGRGSERRLRVAAPFAAVLRPGESISVDGVCLTVTRRSRTWFEAVVSPETLSRTTIALRGSRERVNLERALRAGDRLGGHLVQGHVDAVGVVETVHPEGTGTRVRIRFPAALSDGIVLKGSIAVDGVSLTVAAVRGIVFEAALIPETLKTTRLREYVPGTAVNLEVDIMGRYVVEYLKGRAAAGRSGPPVTRDHLARHGFAGREGAR